MKVHRINPIEMILCDINPEVGKTVPSYYETFSFYNKNGFEERLCHKTDFTFIDPPYVDSNDWLDVDTLTSNIDNWVVWYPIFVTGKMLEINDGHRIEMLWRTNSKMHGCGMAFSKDFSKDDLQFIYNCVPFMAWTLSATEWTKKDCI